MGKRNDDLIPKTQVRIKCKCGSIIHFKRNFPTTCRMCGRRVYPTKQAEFIDKLKRKGVMMY